MRVSLESYADGRVSIKCTENLDVHSGNTGIEQESDVTLVLIADDLQTAVPAMISRFAEMQQRFIDGLRNLGIKIQHDSVEDAS